MPCPICKHETNSSVCHNCGGFTNIISPAQSRLREISKQATDEAHCITPEYCNKLKLECDYLKSLLRICRGEISPNGTITLLPRQIAAIDVALS
jgi:hypothetical protein